MADENNQNAATPAEEAKAEIEAVTQDAQNIAEKASEPYKAFATKEDFDRHAAGILNSAKGKAEKELLAMLGLKPDEKDKVAKFKEAYDATLSDAEKQAARLAELDAQVAAMRAELAEKDAVIAALGKESGKSVSDVLDRVRMAKGLVDEETDINAAIEKVWAMIGSRGAEAKPLAPQGKPLAEPCGAETKTNPFQTGNLTEQGRAIKTDREKAREMYFAAYGRAPSW